MIILKLKTNICYAISPQMSFKFLKMLVCCKVLFQSFSSSLTPTLLFTLKLINRQYYIPGNPMHLFLQITSSAKFLSIVIGK